MARSLDLRVGLLGGFRLLVAGRCAVRVPSVRQQQIIAFLVLHACNAPVARQKIAGSLWPESRDPQALTNLRRELHHLRDEWPALDAIIEAGTRTLTWRGEDASVDVVTFEAAAERGLAGDRAALEEGARLYTGDLLPDTLGEWIDADRERLHRRAEQVMARLVDLCEREHAFAAAIEHAQQLLRLNPLDEHVWCALMRSHAGRGERGAALHAYQQCAAILKKELGVQPGPATRMTYRDVLDLDAATLASSLPRTAVYPLVGRDAEWRTLRTAWQTAAAGRPRLALLRGESGIGKSRLADEQVCWCRINNVNAATARCFAGEGRLAYAPIATWLKSDALQPTLARLDATLLLDIATLCPELASARSDMPEMDRQVEKGQRLRFFEAMAQAFRLTTPLVLVVDDLQWADADTIDWLHYFLRSAGDARCLIVGAIRAEEEQDNPALGRLLRALEHDDLLTVLALGRLDLAATGQLAAAVAGEQLNEMVLARTFHETEGHPLFIIERGRTAMAKGTDAGGDQPRRQVQSVVAERLSLLSAEARTVAEVASAVGRDFRFDILAHASDLDEHTLVRALDELWRRHIVREQADERWDFSHDRIREVAYASIAPARRRLIHRRIAQGLESLYADRLDDASASIAVHLERGGQASRVIPFLERAAAVAMRVSANDEAISCLTRALALLDAQQPAGKDRDDRELGLRSALSVALTAGRGYAAPEVEENLNRVLALSHGDDQDQVPVRWLWAAFTLRFVRGDLAGTREMAEATLARSLSDPSCRCEAHHAMAATLLSLGELDASRDHFEQALAAYDERNPKRSALGSDLGVFAHAWYAHTLWLLGDEPAALAHAEQGIALAQRQNHLYSRALALAYAALLHQMRRDAEQVLACAESVKGLCEHHEIAYYGDWAEILIGWVRGHEQPARGVETIESALERLDTQRAHARRPYYLSLLAETYVRGGDGERASAILDAAIAMAVERADVWWLPALYLQKSALEPAPACDVTLRRGLAAARAQNSLSLERQMLSALSRTI